MTSLIHHGRQMFTTSTFYNFCCNGGIFKNSLSNGNSLPNLRCLLLYLIDPTAPLIIPNTEYIVRVGFISIVPIKMYMFANVCHLEKKTCSTRYIFILHM